MNRPRTMMLRGRAIVSSRIAARKTVPVHCNFALCLLVTLKCYDVTVDNTAT